MKRLLRILKRTLLAFLAAAALLLLAAGVYGLAIGPLRNDRAAKRLLEELLETLPPEAAVVETAAWAGNSSGTGNHVELWAGALLRQEVPEGFGISAEAIREHPERCPDLPNADIKALFPALAAAEDWSAYVLYGTFGEAVTQWDLRGH